MFAALPSSSLFPPAVALHAVAFFAFFVDANNAFFRDSIFSRKVSELVVVVALSFLAAFKRAAEEEEQEEDARRDENLLLFVVVFCARTSAGGGDEERGGETRPASGRDIFVFFYLRAARNEEFCFTQKGKKGTRLDSLSLDAKSTQRERAHTHASSQKW